MITDAQDYPEDILYDSLIEKVREDNSKEVSKLFGDYNEFMDELVHDIYISCYELAKRNKYNVRFTFSGITKKVDAILSEKGKAADTLVNGMFYTDIITVLNFEAADYIRCLLRGYEEEGL